MKLLCGSTDCAEYKQLKTARMTKKTMRRGATIFAKGDAGTGLVGVLRGSVKIGLMAADGREAVLNVVNAVEIFGEMALLDGRPRSADATAMSDCDLVSMDRATFVSVLREQPDVSLKVIEFLCARLRRTNEQVQDVIDRVSLCAAAADQ